MQQSPESLERFVEAQAPLYRQVLAELRAGRKTSHWMWFVFPQLRALGRSGTAKFFGIADLAEARAYSAHPILGPRLRECAQLVTTHRDRSAHQIFGSPDDLKLRSCATLFEAADPSSRVFADLLTQFYAGERDALTLAHLASPPT